MPSPRVLLSLLGPIVQQETDAQMHTHVTQKGFSHSQRASGGPQGLRLIVGRGPEVFPTKQCLYHAQDADTTYPHTPCAFSSAQVAKEAPSGPRSSDELCRLWLMAVEVAFTHCKDKLAATMASVANLLISIHRFDQASLLYENTQQYEVLTLALTRTHTIRAAGKVRGR